MPIATLLRQQYRAQFLSWIRGLQRVYNAVRTYLLDASAGIVGSPARWFWAAW